MVTFRHWRKATRSQGSSGCVEVGRAPGAVGVRDTKDRDGGTLQFTTAQWRDFLSSIKTDH